MLFRFMEGKEGMNFAPVFNALLGSLDEASKGLIVRRLEDNIPTTAAEQRAWFEPYLGPVEGGQRKHYEGMARNLKRTLVFNNGISPVGLLRSCLDFALNDHTKLGGVFEVVTERFRVKGARNLLDSVQALNDFRNTRIAHQEEPLQDVALAKKELLRWVDTLKDIAQA